MNARRLRAILGVLLADARAHRLQTTMTLLGVAVGVAVVVAIRLASAAALDQFKGTYRGLTGVATHELRGVGPLPAARLPELLRTPGVGAAQPVVAATLIVAPEEARDGDPAGPADRATEGVADAAPSPRTDGPPDPDAVRTLRLVGVDPFLASPFLQLDPATVAAADTHLFERLMTEPGLVALGADTLRRLGRPEGGELVVIGPEGRTTLHALPLADPRLDVASPPFLLADLATAQEILGLGDAVLRFDLVIDGDPGAVPLRPGERLERPESRGERADGMTRAFRLNLLCLGFLAVLVGAFVAFNMAQFAVTRRRALLGRLRCLGCPGRELMVATLGEAAVLGLLGGALGVAGGRLLARFLVADVARTVTTLYGPVGGTPVPELDLATAVGALAIAVLATVAATWAPARAAARTPPVTVAGGAGREGPVRPAVPLAFALAAALLLLPTGSAVLLPALSVLALLLALATVLPRLLGRLVRHLPRPTVVALAAGRIERSLARTGSAAGALAMPLAMTVAIAVMVGSFRAEVGRWSQAVLGADVYVRPLDLELAPETARLDEALLDALAAAPGVAVVDRLRTREDVVGEHTFLVAGARLEMARRRGALRVLQGGDLDQVLARVEGGEALISEPLARRTGLGPGDALPLHTVRGERSLTVAGVFQDFSLDRGYALLKEDRFLELYGDPGVRSAAVILKPGADADAFAARLAASHPEVDFRTVGRLRDEVLEAFDQTFAITYVLQTISTALALLGILTALLCLHLERRHELGVLRAIGARVRVVGGLLMVEAGLIMAVAVAAAIPVGLGLAWILVAVVNTRSFGWSFPMLVQPGVLAGVVGLALVVGLLAGLVPWVLVRRASVARLLEVTP